MIQQINRKVLPVSATGRNKITIDVRAIGASELRYLNDLPDLDGSIPVTNAQMKTVWAYTTGDPAEFVGNWKDTKAKSVAASGISMAVGPLAEDLKDRFNIQTTTSNFDVRLWRLSSTGS